MEVFRSQRRRMKFLTKCLHEYIKTCSCLVSEFFHFLALMLSLVVCSWRWTILWSYFGRKKKWINENLIDCSITHHKVLTITILVEESCVHMETVFPRIYSYIRLFDLIKYSHYSKRWKTLFLCRKIVHIYVGKKFFLA